MNVKYILLFTLYVVLPNGLCSKNKTTFDPKQCVHLAETWKTMDEDYTPFYTDAKGNIYMKILVKTGAKQNYLFLPNAYEVGVHVTAKDVPKKVTEELTNYLAELFKISTWELKLLGKTSLKQRTVLFKAGNGLTAKEIIEIICKTLSEYSEDT